MPWASPSSLTITSCAWTACSLKNHELDIKGVGFSYGGASKGDAALAEHEVEVRCMHALCGRCSHLSHAPIHAQVQHTAPCPAGARDRLRCRLIHELRRRRLLVVSQCYASCYCVSMHHLIRQHYGNCIKSERNCACRWQEA